MAYFCPECGAPVMSTDRICPKCGYHLDTHWKDFENIDVNPDSRNHCRPPHTPLAGDWFNQSHYLVRSRKTMAILAILFGTFGVQFFYIKWIKQGIICILFCWTLIPTIIGIIMGIRLLLSSDATFEQKYYVIEK